VFSSVAIAFYEGELRNISNNVEGSCHAFFILTRSARLIIKGESSERKKDENLKKFVFLCEIH
jgi:hypothetical protein